jgi:leukotriene-A4 hydrolase
MAIRPISDAAVERAAASIHQPRDPNTLSNYNAWRTKHTTANFEIDFEAKRLKGNVELSLEKLADERKIVLDTRLVAYLAKLITLH